MKETLNRNLYFYPEIFIIFCIQRVKNLSTWALNGTNCYFAKSGVTIRGEFYMNETNLLTYEEAALKFKVEKSTIENWIRNNQLPKECLFNIGSIDRLRKNILEQFYKINIDEIITIKELIDCLKFYFKEKNINENTVRSWIRRKKIPQSIQFKICGTVRFKRDVLERFLSGELVEIPA